MCLTIPRGSGKCSIRHARLMHKTIYRLFSFISLEEPNSSCPENKVNVTVSIYIIFVSECNHCFVTKPKKVTKSVLNDLMAQPFLFNTSNGEICRCGRPTFPFFSPAHLHLIFFFFLIAVSHMINVFSAVTDACFAPAQSKPAHVSFFP